MLLIATSIGVMAVILLTAVGEGARDYITGEFRSLGTNLLIVIPGRNETSDDDWLSPHLWLQHSFQ